ncbi:MAG TPA: peptide chain release factor N(5)-glutamine methyltransferase [Defluviitaleaceae bacterium]|nr:peptide chain release factor N(5)-glutamine methyltransferase [Defluviitaleaceae bacterium]
MKKNIEELLKEAKRKLKDKGIKSWALDSEVLLSHILSFSRVQLYTHSKKELEEDIQEKYNNLISKRIKGVPVQYLTNTKEFMSLSFYVDKSVLIPRNDTEILVENALELIDKKDSIILDMCTGSGCIAVSIAYYRPETKVFALDLSASALKVAQYNAKLNEVENRVFFMQSNLFEKLEEDFLGKFDMIISNPPYIPTEDIAKLEVEVKDYEPLIALDGGKDGLDFYRIITEKSKAYLKDKGTLIFEIGYNQGEAVGELLRNNGFSNINIKKDLAGLDRVVFGSNIK